MEFSDRDIGLPARWQLAIWAVAVHELYPWIMAWTVTRLPIFEVWLVRVDPLERGDDS